MNSLGGRITNRQMAQNFVRRLQSLTLRHNSTAATATASSNAEPEIQIPMRKERSPTDLLNALEKTIKRDPTAPHYKYHDDPFLIPMSNMNKRTFALSKESGRKAAMWVLQEHADLFQHKLAEPEIPAFAPKAVYTSKDQVSEELLMSVIEQGSVGDALTIYKLLEGEVSVKGKQALLELLCFYNNEEQLPETLTEERWYRKAATRQRQIWKHSAEIEEIFEFLKQQEGPVAAEAYNALICGTAKYMKVDKAWSLFEECEEKGIPLTLTTYNSIIQLVSVLRDGAPERKALLLELFSKMDAAGIRPNIGTFNAALRVSSMINIGHVSRELTRTLFTEFRRLGIQPSLASYYFALITFCKDRGPKSNVLYEIMNELYGRTFTMQDQHDTFFFVTAMDIARNHLQDGAIAKKIHELLLTGDNYNFIGEGFKESIYYRHYMVLMLKTLPIEEFIELYDILVPHIYIPEPSVMEEVLNTLDLAEASVVRDILPRLWSQMTMFDQLDRQPLVTKAMQLMRTHSSATEDLPVNRLFADAAWSLWTFVADQNERRQQPITWSGTVLGDVAVLSLRGGEFDKFLQIIAHMKKEQNAITGTAEIDQLNEMFEACLERGYAPGLIDIVQYCVESGFDEAATMARKVISTIPLTPNEENQLSNLVGPEVLKIKNSNDV